MVARIPVAAPAWLRDFMEPEAYLQQYAEGLSPLKRYIDQLIAAETEETAIPETTAQGGIPTNTGTTITGMPMKAPGS